MGSMIGSFRGFRLLIMEWTSENLMVHFQDPVWG